MKTLSTEFRRQLERTIIEARDVAETGARVALEALAVQHHEPYDHMGSGQRTLRRRLRAHARQLGDRPEARSGSHSIEHLVHECAYEHWHGMLFARFLAENHLLIEPEMGVAITLDECEALAEEDGVDKWALAARFAHRMLPQVFRPDHPVFEVQFAREHRIKLEGLVEGLPADVFAATDALGWVYQFWQTKKKVEVNAAGNKIGANELPSVTQLFTEDYMVDFLLDNTLGAWHAIKVLSADPKLAADARSEDELRQAVAVPGCPWKYLRFIQGKDGKWTTAAGTFDGWPETTKELTCLDPCMGSGHFVVAMFDRLVALRSVEEQIDEVTAVAAVIHENLFGLEIDPRCTQIGAFNLALAAWRRVGHRPLPTMNLACSGLAPNTHEADWLEIAGDNQKLQRGMERLYRLFRRAAVLGSLINPRAGKDDLLEATFHELKPLLEKAMAQETTDDEAHELAVTAHGLAKAAEILAGQYTLVATNVPFLTQSKFSPELKEHIYSFLDLAKENLASAFALRMADLTAKHGVVAFVSPQSWWFLKRYAGYRKWLLTHQAVKALYRLGERAFESPQAGGELVGLSIIQNSEPERGDEMLLADASSGKEPSEKAAMLLSVDGLRVKYGDILRSGDLAYRAAVGGDGKIGDVASVLQGLVTGDSAQYFGKFWERARNGDAWECLQSTSSKTTYYGGLTDVILWEREQGRLAALAESVKGINHSAQNWRKGKPNWGKRGVVVSQMGNFPATLYLGDRYDHNCCAIVPNDDSEVVPLWLFCSSEAFANSVRALNQNRKIEVGTVLNTDYDRAYWHEAAAERYPHGLPKPSSRDPTQWLFDGQPRGSDAPLQVAVARLLAYQWPRQTGSRFPDCPVLGADDLEEIQDEDGIVCIPAVRGERPAHERLLKVLQTAWEDNWDEGVAAKLLADVGSASLDDWLRNQFFEEHCRLFHHRPFIWHVWDGRKRDGFHALINYHKLADGDGKGRRLLESLTYSYLGDWISRQQDGVKRGEGGAEDRLAVALELQQRLVAILEGEPPFDLFVRWKPIEEQPIGWEPDINDGVRLNIRPFMAKDIRYGKKGAGILRAKTNIHWNKDRGKDLEHDPAQYPWFWENGKFTGERVNDVHLTLAEKRAAREVARASRGEAGFDR